MVLPVRLLGVAVCLPHVVVGAGLLGEQVAAVGLLADYVARGGEQGAVVVALAVEVLPGVTGGHVDVRPYRVEVLLVVGVEVEQRVGAVLVNVVVGAGAVLVVGVPHRRGVALGDGVLVGLAHVVAQVQVETELGQEVQRIVELQVAVAAPHAGHVGALLYGGHRVVHAVGVELVAVHLRGVAVEELARRAVRHRVVGVRRAGRVGRERAAHRAAGVGELVLDEVALHVGLHLKLAVEELGGEVDARGDAVHRGVAYDAAVAGVGDGHAVWQEPGLSAHAEAVVVRDGGAQHLVLPVGVGFAQGHGCRAAGSPVARHYVAVLVAGEHVPCLAGRLHGHVGGEVDLGLAILAPLGGDDYHAVAGAAAVDGRGRRVLEDGHRLDVVGRDHRQRVAHALRALVAQRHAVEHDERVVGGVERRAAADADGARALGAGRRGDHHARGLAHEQVLYRRRQPGGYLRGLHRGHRPGGVLLLNRTVADGHHLVEHQRALLQGDGQRGLPVNGHRLRLVADV